ncbi:hypothetical protein P153DRAFT_26151 [Dothidotthia symphoricarpi CBS 119687]|uniref:Uncharacterized protein n=1 Tax=Dothidotthia symphoricarpi CBS 119687 TaxID=1392245 RepID=A0A6A6AAI9_9PLEO|nr:uncharacterized protein P153DRAFT_26151 [Dothidotthia symphoricarpi CBS 119687]KAF2128809.1 hypothetical protein P153DRAFT_26151 [Dothidotthia symphoricarpi CBS 119687]
MSARSLASQERSRPHHKEQALASSRTCRSSALKQAADMSLTRILSHSREKTLPCFLCNWVLEKSNLSQYLHHRRVHGAEMTAKRTAGSRRSEAAAVAEARRLKARQKQQGYNTRDTLGMWEGEKFAEAKLEALSVTGHQNPTDDEPQLLEECVNDRNTGKGCYSFGPSFLPNDLGVGMRSIAVRCMA